MKTYSIQDRYNDSKIWLVKIYGKGQVYYNQEIAGIKFNPRFQPTTKAWIKSILTVDLNERLSDQEQEELLNDKEVLFENSLRDHKHDYAELFSNIHGTENNCYKNKLPF